MDWTLGRLRLRTSLFSFIVHARKLLLNSSHSLALASMPRWKSARANFSLGLWRIVVVLAPAHQQRIGAQPLVESCDDGNRAAFAGKYGPAAESVLDGPGRRLDVRAVQRHQHARRTVMLDQFDFHARRSTVRPAAASGRR